MPEGSNVRKARSAIVLAGIMLLITPFVLLGIDPGNGPALACSIGIVLAILVVGIAILGSSGRRSGPRDPGRDGIGR